MAVGVEILRSLAIEADIWKLACIIDSEGANTMTRETILYLSGQASCSGPVSAALSTAGYEVVSTKSPMQAIALLFILHPVAAVFLDSREIAQPSCDAARSLKAVRPDVLIVLLCCDPIDRLPSYLDASISTSQPLANLISGLKSLLAEKQVNSCEHTL